MARSNRIARVVGKTSQRLHQGQNPLAPPGSPGRPIKRNPNKREREMLERIKGRTGYVA